MTDKLDSNRFSRRDFLRLSTIAGASLLAAQCGPSATSVPATEASKPTAAAVKAKVVIAAGADASTEPMRDMINSGMAEKALGFPVEWVEMPYSTLYEKLVQVGQSKGSDFDLFMMDDPWVPQFAGGGYVMNMTKMGYKPGPGYIDRCLDLGWWPPKTGPRVPGIGSDVEPELYILPIIGDCQIFFYRTDLLEQAGIAPPETWDDILNIANKMAKPDQGLYVLAARGVRGNPVVTEWFPYLYSFGAEMFDEKWNVTFNKQEGMDALQLFVDLLKWEPPGVATYDSDEQGACYLQGNCITNIEWTGWISQAEDPDKSKVVGKTGWALTPKKVRHASEIGNWVMGIAAGSKNSDGALKFLDWFLQDDVQTDLATRKGIPVKLAPYDDKALQAQFPWLPTVKNALENSVWRARTPEWPKVEDTLGLHLNMALTKQESVQDALNNAAKEVTDYLKSVGYYA
jgi:multiple sugar transport system substrate-binding protein